VTSSDADRRRLILWTIAMSLLGIALFWSLYLARTVLLLVYVSAILAIGFSPAVRWL
jgi:predicted PurR-regulated permease PerM